MRTGKKIILIVAGLLMVGIAYGIYLYNKPHRSVASEDAAYEVSAEDLFKQYSLNEVEANKLYLDKVLVVSGKIKEVSQNELKETNVILSTGDEMFGISCALDKTEEGTKNLKEGDTVEMKGLCTGMLNDVVLINCSVEGD